MSEKTALEIQQEAYIEISRFLQSTSRTKGLTGVNLLDLAWSLVGDDRLDFLTMYLRQYRSLRSQLVKPDEKPTHTVITELAAGIANYTNNTALVISGVTGPDESANEMLLAMEGHFYGRLENGEFGNYLAKMHLQEYAHTHTAKSEFISHHDYYRSTSGPDQVRNLAWSLHYLQDLTAPHHAGNFPAILSWLTDRFDTHHQFEVVAQSRINQSANQKAYASAAELLMDELADCWSSGKDAFAQRIFELSSPDKSVVNIIKDTGRTHWSEVIDRQLPLAIAASAVVLKNSP